MIQKLKKDIPAGIVVFLVALPLCLGVALASGAPLLSGIISGVIGGVVVGFLSKSDTSVSGPAAGLSAVVLSSIMKLGVFETFLTAVVLAGVFQMIFGFLKGGFIANYIPSSVIKGLLAAIGIILILKQIPHAVGFDNDIEDDFSFFQPDGENTFSEILVAFNFITPGAIVVSILSLLVLMFWDKSPMRKLPFIPSSLFVVVLGVLLDRLFDQFIPFLAIQPSHLVNIPGVDTSNLSEHFHLPTLGDLSNYQVWFVALTIAVIASLETLLNLEAVDKIDPEKRHSPPNRELVAQGAGNIASGLLGGIPITSVIVRSSINIQAGNESKLSAILHGVFLLLSVFFLAPVLNLIPLASLAVILIFTGYKLAKISLFKEMYSKGLAQFAPFIVTVVAIVFTDLLVGVLVGLGASIFFLLLSNFKNPFKREETKFHIGEIIHIELSNQVSFLNKTAIKSTLWSIPREAKVEIDASHTNYIDHDVLEIIDDFVNYTAPSRRIQLNVIGIRDKYHKKDQIQFINILDKKRQQEMSPMEVLDLLKSGNHRFLQGKHSEKNYMLQANATASGQNPMAIIIGCIDSRTSPEIIFDASLGDILTIRVAGNIASPEIIGSIELAIDKFGVKLIVVKGHSSCGAVATSLHGDQQKNVNFVVQRIYRAVEQSGFSSLHPDEIDEEKMEIIAKRNTENSILDIMNESPFLKEKIENNEVGVVSAYHNLATGQVHFGEIR